MGGRGNGSSLASLAAASGCDRESSGPGTELNGAVTNTTSSDQGGSAISSRQTQRHQTHNYNPRLTTDKLRKNMLNNFSCALLEAWTHCRDAAGSRWQRAESLTFPQHSNFDSTYWVREKKINEFLVNKPPEWQPNIWLSLQAFKCPPRLKSVLVVLSSISLLWDPGFRKSGFL